MEKEGQKTKVKHKQTFFDSCGRYLALNTTLHHLVVEQLARRCRRIDRKPCWQYMWKACCIAVSSFTPLDFQPMMKHVASWLVLFATSVIAVDDKLQCYQCLVTENKLCTEDFLKPCPKHQAFDRCMTVISNSKESGYQIEKKCALAPCTLRDPKQNEGLGLDHCDRSKPEFNCISCCKGDGCNKDGSENLQPFATHIIIVISHFLGFFYNRIII